MTKKWRKVVLKEQRDVLARIICDRCGADISRPKILSSHETEVREFELSFYEGSNWAEEGLNCTGWRVSDLCDKCLAVLKEWLIANGFNVQEYDPSYDPREYEELPSPISAPVRDYHEEMTSPEHVFPGPGLDVEGPEPSKTPGAAVIHDNRIDKRKEWTA